MNKIVTASIFPEQETTVEVVLYRFSRFLFNDGNKLFFESGYIKNNEEDVFEKHIFNIVKYTENMEVPTYGEFVCSYVDNAHVRYFVYEDTSNHPFTQFSKIFGGFGI